MGEVIELVSRGALAKAVHGRREKAARGRYRVVRLAQEQAKGITAEAAEGAERKAEMGPANPSDRREREREEDEREGPVSLADLTGFADGRGPANLANPVDVLAGREKEREKARRGWRAEECLGVYEVEEGAIVVFWKLAEVDEWGAPVLGAACNELLNRRETKQVIFDFSGVEAMSTAGIGTLVRFQNTVVHLGVEMYVVAGARLREQLARSWADRMFEVREHVYSLLGSEIRFVEKRQARPLTGRSRGFSRSGVVGILRKGLRWAAAAVVVWLVIQQVFAQAVDRSLPSLAVNRSFPSLGELEQMLTEAPDLRAIKVELKKLKLEKGWGNQTYVYATHSQYFSSFLPFLPTEEFGAGGTSVGISVSVPLGRLLGRPTPEDLDYQLKELEYERVFQTKLAALRRLYREREKLLGRLTALAAQSRTAELELEEVKLGIAWTEKGAERGRPRSFFVGAVDLAQAEEKVTQLEVERREIELEIKTTEVEILALLGKGRIGP